MVTCDLNRVKELNKDVARRALKHAVVNNASMTSTTIDSARSCRSVTPPSPCCYASLDNDVLASMPCNDLTTQRLRDVFAHCSPRNLTPSQTVRQRVSDGQIMPDVDRVASNDALSTDRGAYFVPLSGSRSPRRQKTRRRRPSTLDDIDESLDETVFHGRHSVLDLRQQSHQLIMAWASDDECDDKNEVVAKKHEPDVNEADSRVQAGGDVQTQPTDTDTGKHQSTRSLHSDPAVSLDHHRATRYIHSTPVAAGVQSDFVLSSTTRPVAALYPREAVSKMCTEGDRTSSACCALSSTVCSRLGDCDLPSDTSGDCCQLQTCDKVSSKLNDLYDVLPAGSVRNECLAMNNNLTCYRLEQVVQDKSRCGETTRATNDVASSEAVRTTAGKIRILETTDSRQSVPAVRQIEKTTTTTTTDDGWRTETQTRQCRQSDSKQVPAVTSRSQGVKKQQIFVDSNSATNNKSDWESSPDTIKLLAELINKISELALRQDQLERITSTSRRVITNNSSQTDDERTEARDGSGVSHVISTSPLEPSSTRQQEILDEAGQSVVSRQEERLLTQTRKQRCTSKSQKPEQKMSSDQQKNNDVPEAKRAIQTTPTNYDDDAAAEPTKLANSSPVRQQLDDVDVAVERQRPPPHFVKSSPLSAVKDNIIHIVRGSSALDDLTVEDLMREYSERGTMSAETSTEAYSQPLDHAARESNPRVTNGLQQHIQGPTTHENVCQHSSAPQSRDDQQKSQDSGSLLAQQSRDPEIIQDNPELSPRPQRESRTPQDVASSAPSLRPFMRPLSEQLQPAQGDERTGTERYEKKTTSSFNTSDDHAKRRMQYVL